MPAWAWAGIAAFYTLCALFVLGLCRAAAIGDETPEQPEAEEWEAA